MAIRRGARQNGLPEQTGNGESGTDGATKRPTTTEKRKRQNQFLNFPFPAVSGAPLSSDVRADRASAAVSGVDSASRPDPAVSVWVYVCAAGQTRKIKKNSNSKDKKRKAEMGLETGSSHWMKQRERKRKRQHVGNALLFSITTKYQAKSQNSRSFV